MYCYPASNQLPCYLQYLHTQTVLMHCHFRPAVTISAPAQTTTSKASNDADDDDDDILATLQKYEAEAKRETTKKPTATKHGLTPTSSTKQGLMPTQVKRPAPVTQTTVTVKKLAPPAVKNPAAVKTPAAVAATPQGKISSCKLSARLIR